MVRARPVASLKDDADAAKVQDRCTVDTLPGVALMAQEIGELGEHLLLVVDLKLLNQRLQRNCRCIHRLRTAGHRGLCNDVLAALEISPPLIVQSLELFFGKIAEYTEQDYGKRLNVATPPCAGDVNQDEHHRLNAITQSFNHEVEEDAAKKCMCAPTRPEEIHRCLLSDPSEVSFVLWKASKPWCNSDAGDEYEEWCAPTQMDDPPPRKAHAFLNYRRESAKGKMAEKGNIVEETPPLSPKTTADETPPPSPGFVPESEPEANGDEASKTTAQHSPCLLDIAGMIGSPFITSVGRMSNKQLRRETSLKKPTCDTFLGLPGEESDAEAYN